MRIFGCLQTLPIGSYQLKRFLFGLIVTRLELIGNGYFDEFSSRLSRFSFFTQEMVEMGLNADRISPILNAD
jgi:hypothetical protein